MPLHLYNVHSWLTWTLRFNRYFRINFLAENRSHFWPRRGKSEQILMRHQNTIYILKATFALDRFLSSVFHCRCVRTLKCVCYSSNMRSNFSFLIIFTLWGGEFEYSYFPFYCAANNSFIIYSICSSFQFQMNAISKCASFTSSFLNPCLFFHVYSFGSSICLSVCVSVTLPCTCFFLHFHSFSVAVFDPL